MSAVRTAIAGMVGLALLEAATSSQAAAGRVGGLLTGVAKVIEHILSPTVPAIPDLRTRGGGGGGLLGRKADPQQQGGGATGSLLPPDWTTKAPMPTSLNA